VSPSASVASAAKKSALLSYLKRKDNHHAIHRKMTDLINGIESPVIFEPILTA
jgi:hypothetical protein